MRSTSRCTSPCWSYRRSRGRSSAPTTSSRLRGASRSCSSSRGRSDRRQLGTTGHCVRRARGRRIARGRGRAARRALPRPGSRLLAGLVESRCRILEPEDGRMLECAREPRVRPASGGSTRQDGADEARAGPRAAALRRRQRDGARLRMRRGRPRRGDRVGQHGRRGPGYAPERAAQGLHGCPQRCDLTGELAAKARADPAERASFDPFFTFFLGGVAVFDGDVRVGAIGVSGLPGEDDDALARRAVEAAGLSVRS